MVQSDMISTDRVRPCFSEKPETIPAKNQGCASGRSIHQIVYDLLFDCSHFVQKV